MKKIILILFFAHSVNVAAAPTQEKESLLFLLEELDRVELLLERAQQSASSNTKLIKFDYQSVRKDLDLIKNGIRDYINDRRYSPRRFAPVEGDYRR